MLELRTVIQLATIINQTYSGILTWTRNSTGRSSYRGIADCLGAKPRVRVLLKLPHTVYGMCYLLNLFAADKRFNPTHLIIKNTDIIIHITDTHALIDNEK